MRDVPDDEAEVRELLTQNEIPFFETFAEIGGFLCKVSG